ncbi:MAG: cupin domain-containing protein [Candidatus Eremiobacteraeota bacterium]|nr:cupin domain-containing protein [Candidatus Eremiobacteraeota bacterium]MBV8498045.1 cupin domain-containing protein [Candidatus Eremiobacteraeota bacterium]
MRLMRSILTGLGFAAALTAIGVASAPTIVTPDTAKWQPVPQFKGWEMAPIVGNPEKAGAYYAYLLKAPSGGAAPPHFHGMTENVTVLSGQLMVGIGDKMDTSAMKPLGPGSVVSIPAGVHHYAMAKGETVIEVSGIGPDTTTLLHK